MAPAAITVEKQDLTQHQAANGGTIPISDQERHLQAIARLRIASRRPNDALDEIAAAAARIFGVPSALITIGLGGNDWFQGQYGLPPGFAVSGDTPGPFTVGPGEGITGSLTLADLSDDDVRVRGDVPTRLGSRFYAGVPVVSADGRAVGTLYILDSAPRRFSRKDMELLHALAARALDETELRADRDRVERELQSAEERSREKTEMVAWTAHEMKNPLTVIKGISTMLAADPKFPLDMRTEFMHTISKQVDRLLRIIDETLDLARLENGLSIRLNVQEMDLAERLVNVTEFYAAASPRHQLQLKLGPGSHLIVADRDKLDQVLYNLVGNAVKYSPAGGPVNIRSRIRPESVEIEVEDRGLGMTPEQIEQIFDRFARAHTQSAPHIKGTGLGLYLTRHLVEAHGGQVGVESAPGKGSCFHFRIPIRRANYPTDPDLDE